MITISDFRAIVYDNPHIWPRFCTAISFKENGVDRVYEVLGTACSPKEALEQYKGIAKQAANELARIHAQKILDELLNLEPKIQP